MSAAVVLASTSRYRAELLGRLLDTFAQAAPGVDETPLPAEAPGARALRLAIAKAEAVAGLHPGALVIGSDQVAELDGRMLDKPGTEAIARAQLHASSGRTVRFHTALCVLDGRDGSRSLVDVGGSVLAQDEASSVVWGMPGAVTQAGLAEAVMPLTSIGAELVRRLSNDPASAGRAAAGAHR